MRKWVLGVAAGVALSGCAATGVDHMPAPASTYRDAEPVGLTDVRVWGDVEPEGFDRRNRAGKTLDFIKRRAEATGEKPKMTLLAVSGGAADGAYGAGILNGWTARGDRPVFDVVTGISTGALIAPFAFLGRDYDEALKFFFTNTRTEDIAEIALFSAVFRGSLGLADSSPLRNRIALAMTDPMIAEVAKAHAEGRRLFIGTTNLDARRPVIWDMGAIASANTDEARALFRSVLAASAAIPGAFQPSFIKVSAGGRTYTEMHVDGGVTNSVFLAPRWFDGPDFTTKVITGGVDVYVIQNNKVIPNYGPAQPKIVDILASSVSELIRNQSQGDLLRIYSVSQARGFSFNLAFVPTEFNVESKEGFDPVYMRALFDVGFGRGRDFSAWVDEPPGLPRLLKPR